MDSNNEERIRKQKDKKLSKHFDGMVNDVKIKILNFRFKIHKTPKETVDVIEIISKVKFHELDRENALIRIENEKSIIEVTGDWKYGWSGPGENGVAYSIKKKTEQNTPPPHLAK